MRLGSYSLPQLDGDIKAMTRTLDKGYTASIIDNGDYRLATVALEGWKNGVRFSVPGSAPRQLNLRGARD